MKLKNIGLWPVQSSHTQQQHSINELQVGVNKNAKRHTDKGQKLLLMTCLDDVFDTAYMDAPSLIKLLCIKTRGTQ